MPSGGHNRKTDAEHQRNGTYRKDRHGEPDEKVDFPDGAMEPPASLGEGARKEWFRISSILKDAGLLKPAYRVAITRYCVLAAQADELGAAFGDDKELRQYITMLGLSPQAVSKIGAGARKKQPAGKFADV